VPDSPGQLQQISQQLLQVRTEWGRWGQPQPLWRLRWARVLEVGSGTKTPHPGPSP
jgi:hypothetical protein